MNTQTELRDKIYTALEFAGFARQEDDGDIDNPVNDIYNDANVYIGDILEARDFTKSEEVKNGKTWTTFKRENVVVSHRSFSEKPDATSFNIKALDENGNMIHDI